MRYPMVFRPVLLLLLVIGAPAAPLYASDALLSKAERYYNNGQLNEAQVTLKALLQDGEDAAARLMLGRVYLAELSGRAAEQELQRAMDLGAPQADAAPLIARALLLQRDYARALDHADVETDDPAVSAHLLALKAAALAEMEESDAAQAALAKALDLAPESAPARVQLARMTYALGDTVRAEEVLEPALTQDPTPLEALEAWADLQVAEGRFADAEVTLTTLASESPKRWLYLYKRALARLELGKIDAAEADIDAGAKIFPRFVGFDYARARVALARGDDSSALASAERFLKANPNDPVTNLVAAQAAARLELPERARSYLQTHLEAMPGSLSGNLFLAQVQLDQGELSAAEKTLTPLVSVDDPDPAALLARARVRQAQGDLKAAESDLKRVLQRQPDLVDVRLVLATVLAQSGDARAAQNQLERIFATEPEHLGARVEQIRMLLDAGDIEQALRAAETLVEKHPQDAFALSALASAAARAGQVERAKKALEMALEAKPGLQAAALNLAELNLHLGDLAGAKAAYELALESDPTNSAALLGLVQLERNERGVPAAIAKLEAALERAPESVELRLNLAQGYLYAVRFEDAERVLAAAPQSVAGDPRLLEAKGRLALAWDAPLAAASAFEQLMELQPASVDVRFLLAQAYAASSNLTGAIDAMARGFEADPQHPLLIPTFQVLLEAATASAQIDALLDRLSRAQPRHVNLEFMRALAQQEQGETAKATESLSRLAAREPDNALFVKALLRHQASRSGDKAGAVRTARQWLAKHEEDVLTRRQLAQLHAELGDTQAAVAEYQRVLEINPDDFVSLNNLAELVLADDPMAALAYARNANDAAPDNPAIADTLGQALLATGNPDEAVAVLARAQAAAPSDPRVSLHYAQALAANGQRAEARDILLVLLQRGPSSFDGAEDARELFDRLNN